MLVKGDRNMKKRLMICILAVVLICSPLIIGLFVIDHSFYYDEYLPYRSYYGYLRYFTLDREMSEEDEAVAREILETAKQVFEYKGKVVDADKSVGALARYYRDDVESTSVDLQLVTADAKGSNGYIWVIYSVEREHIFDDGTQSKSGSRDILSYWKIEKENGKWIVTDVKEAP